MNSPTISYSQNREDVILDAFFKKKKNGFYIDVGANHPTVDSVTKTFYQRGWTGINVEPNISLLYLLKADRPKDTNLGVGVSNQEGTASFRQYNQGDGLSTFSEDTKNDKDSDYQRFKKDFSDIEVPIITLSTLFMKYAPTSVDFLKIDVEGYEFEVIDGNDWAKFRPEVVCIEANHIHHDWRPILKRNKYTLFFNDGLNDYYAAEESTNLKDFSYPESVFMRYGHVFPFRQHFDEEAATRLIEQANERPQVQKPPTPRQQIKYSLLSFNEGLDKFLVEHMIYQKRANLLSGKTINGSLRLFVYKFCFLCFRVGRKIQAVCFSLLSKLMGRKT